MKQFVHRIPSEANLHQGGANLNMPFAEIAGPLNTIAESYFNLPERSAV